MENQTAEQLQRYLGYLEQDKDNANLLLTISGYYRKLRDLQSAQHYLDQVKELTNNPLWTYQGTLHMDNNNFLLAKEAFQAALNEEDSSEHRYNLAFCLFMRMEYAEALQLIEHVEPVGNGDYLKARLFHQLERYEEALQILEAMYQQDESDDDVMGLLALVYFDNSQLDQAELFAANTLLLNPNNYEAQLVTALLKAAHTPLSSEETAALLKKNPNDYRILLLIGMNHMQEFNFSEAENAFYRIISACPHFYNGWINYAWCQLFLNNINKAEIAYQEAIQLQESNAEGWAGLALVYLLQNESKLSQDMLKKAQELDPNCYLVRVVELFKHTNNGAVEKISDVFQEMEKLDALNTLKDWNPDKKQIH